MNRKQCELKKKKRHTRKPVRWKAFHYVLGEKMPFEKFVTASNKISRELVLGKTCFPKYKVLVLESFS